MIVGERVVAHRPGLNYHIVGTLICHNNVRFGQPPEMSATILAGGVFFPLRDPNPRSERVDQGSRRGNNESGRCKENSSFRLERSEGGYDVGLPLRESAIGDDVVDVVVVYLSLCL